MAHTPTIEQTAEMPPYITVQQAAELFSLPVPTAYARAANEWRAFRVKIGGNVRLNRAELMKWAATQQGR